MGISKFVPTIRVEETDAGTFVPNSIFDMSRDRWQLIVDQMAKNGTMLVEIVRLERNGERNCMVTGSYVDYKTEGLIN